MYLWSLYEKVSNMGKGKIYWKVDGDWNCVIFFDECYVIIGEINVVEIWRGMDIVIY